MMEHTCDSCGEYIVYPGFYPNIVIHDVDFDVYFEYCSPVGHYCSDCANYLAAGAEKALGLRDRFEKPSDEFLQKAKARELELIELGAPSND